MSLPAATGRVCWLAPHSEKPCSGPLQRAHVLTKQKLRQEFPEGAVWLEGRLTALSWHRWERELRHVAICQPVRRMSLRALQDDERTWIVGCELHHNAFDGYRLPVPHAAIPPEILAFAEELGLSAALERDRRFSETVAI